ncbi:MAG: anti-sigma factor domain-containing protein [Clostridia bacterium]|nr:anti-sigma factor domain-containing protein [Clostridia bacterium]
MYKGIIFKVKKEYAIVLADNHLYYKIQIKGNLAVGQKVWFLEEDILEEKAKVISIKTMSATLATLAALFALIFILPNIGNDFDYNVVSIDINPSIEIHVNDDNIVKDVIPLNEEAKDIISEDMINEDILIVISDILHLAEHRDYLSQEDNYVLISTAERNEINLSEEIEAYLNEALDLEGNVTIYYVVSDMKTAKQAQSNGVSLGKMELSNITHDPEVKSNPVRETLMNSEVVKESVASVVKDMKGYQKFEASMTALLSIPSPDEALLEFLSQDAIQLYIAEGTIPDAYKELTKTADEFLKAYDLLVQQETNGLISSINEIIGYLEEIQPGTVPEVDAYLAEIGDLSLLSQQELAKFKQEITTFWNKIKQDYKELWVPGQSEDKKPDNENPGTDKNDNEKPDQSGNKNTSAVDEELLNSLLVVIKDLRIIPVGDIPDVDEFLKAFDAMDLETLTVSTAVTLKKEALDLWQTYRKDYNDSINQEDTEENDPTDGDVEDNDDSTDENNDSDEISSLKSSILVFIDKINDLDIQDETILNRIIEIEALLNDPNNDLKALEKELKDIWKNNK